MSLLFFFVPLHRTEPAASELNAALAAGRVLRLERHFVEAGPEPGWAFCLERAEGPGPLPAGLKAAAVDKGKGGSVDYKQVLSEPDFAAFAALRELRKQLAQAEGVPVYAVFSNEQLAAMATQRVASRSALAAIEGVGPARVEKYAAAVLACLAQQGATEGSAAP